MAQKNRAAPPKHLSIPNFATFGMAIDVHTSRRSDRSLPRPPQGPRRAHARPARLRPMPLNRPHSVHGLPQRPAQQVFPASSRRVTRCEGKSPNLRIALRDAKTTEYFFASRYAMRRLRATSSHSVTRCKNHDLRIRIALHDANTTVYGFAQRYTLQRLRSTDSHSVTRCKNHSVQCNKPISFVTTDAGDATNRLHLLQPTPATQQTDCICYNLRLQCNYPIPPVTTLKRRPFSDSLRNHRTTDGAQTFIICVIARTLRPGIIRCRIFASDMAQNRPKRKIFVPKQCFLRQRISRSREKSLSLRRLSESAQDCPHVIISFILKTNPHELLDLTIERRGFPSVGLLQN